MKSLTSEQYLENGEGKPWPLAFFILYLSLYCNVLSMLQWLMFHFFVLPSFVFVSCDFLWRMNLLLVFLPDSILLLRLEKSLMASVEILYTHLTDPFGLHIPTRSFGIIDGKSWYILPFIIEKYNNFFSFISIDFLPNTGSS